MATVGSVEFEAKLGTQGIDRSLSALESDLARKQLILPASLAVKGADSLGDVFKGATTAFAAFNAENSLYIQSLDILSAKLDKNIQKINSFKQSSLNAFKDFDSARAKVATLSDDAGGVASALQGLANDLDGQVGSTALVAASYDVLSAGFSKTSDQAKILGASAKAAQGGFSDIGTVSDATTTILNAYGQSADNAAKITDQLIATQNAGKITVAEYGSLIGQAASIAASAGVSFEEFSAFVATSTAKGLQAGPAITGLRQAIAALLKPSAEATELAGKLGVEFSASALKTKGLSGVLKDLNDKGAATPDVLTKLFGSVEAVAAIAPAAADGFKLFDSNLQLINNSAGAADEAASKVANSFAGRLTAAANLGNEALISLGEGVKAVVGPFIELGIVGVKAFNALPGPLKAAAGGTLAVAGATATLFGGFVSIASVLPLLLKAYSLFKVRQLAGAALDKIETAGLAAKASALNFLNTQTVAATTTKTALSGSVVANTVALASNTAATVAGGVAKAAWALATSKQAIAAAKLTGTLGLATLAVYAVSEAFKRSEGAQFAKQLDETTEKLKQFQVEAEKASKAPAPGSQSPNTLGDRVDRVGNAIADKGPIEGARTALVEYQAAVFGAADSTDKFGNEFRVLGINLAYVTAEQRGNQLTQLALEKQFQATGQSIANTNDLLSKYGLATIEASDQSRLGADGAAKFKTEAESQIKVLDQQIEALKNQKAPNEEVQAQINGQIKSLESNKNALKQRIFVLDNGYAALQAAKNAEGEFKISVDDTTKALKDAADKADLANKQRLASIKEATAAGTKSETQAAKEVLQAEQESLEERKRQLEEALPKLKAAAAGADEVEAAKAKDAILNTEKEIADTRIKLAENVLERKKQIEKEIGETVKKVDTGELNESAGLGELERLKATAETPEARKKAADEILKIRKDQIEAEISEIQAGQKKIEALQAQGRIGEAKADEDLTKSKRDESKKRVEIIREQIRNSTRDSDRRRLIAEEKKLKSELDKLDAEFEERRKKRQIEAFDDRRKLLEAQLALGKVSQEKANKDLLDNDLKQNDLALKQERDRTKKLLGARVDADKLLDKARKGTLTAAETDQLKQLGKVAELEKKRVEIIAASYDREVALLEQKTKKKLALLGLETVKAQAEIQAQLNAELITQEQAELQRAELRDQSAAKELKAEEDRLKKLQSLQLSTDPRKKADQELRLIDQQTKVQQLKVQKLEAEAAIRENIRKQIIAQIEDEIAAEDRLLKKELAGLDTYQQREIEGLQKGLGLLEKRLEIEEKSLKLNNDITKALNEQQIKALETQISKLDEARSLTQKLADENTGANVKDVAQRQLQELGVQPGATEVEILQKRLAVEERLAQTKLAALDQEQQVARELLEIENRKLIFQTKQLEISAKQLELDARRADVQAEGEQRRATLNLQKAEQLAPGRERDQAIANAQLDLQLANENRQLSQEQIDFAAQNTALAREQAIAVQDEIAGRRELLAIQQQTERASLVDSQQQQRRSSELELAEAGDKAGQRVFIQPSSVDYSAPINVPQSPMGQLPNNASKTYEADLADKFDRLSNQIINLASTPKQLTVQSNEPVQNAAEIWADVNRLKARNNGGLN